VPPEWKTEAYPDGTTTVVFGRPGEDFIVEDKAVKMDCGYPVVQRGTRPRELAPCTWSPGTSYQAR
jgi:hypothetical protein